MRPSDASQTLEAFAAPLGANPSPWHLDHDDVPLFAKLLGAIFLLNVFDGLATILWIHLGVASEANPLMDGLLAAHPALFLATKLTLVGLGLALLWRYRERALARVSGALLAGAYGTLAVYHIVGGTLFT